MCSDLFQSVPVCSDRFVFLMEVAFCDGFNWRSFFTLFVLRLSVLNYLFPINVATRKRRSDGNTAKVCDGNQKMLPEINWDRIADENKINPVLCARELGHYSNEIRSIE